MTLPSAFDPASSWGPARQRTRIHPHGWRLAGHHPGSISAMRLSDQSPCVKVPVPPRSRFYDRFICSSFPPHGGPTIRPAVLPVPLSAHPWPLVGSTGCVSCFRLGSAANQFSASLSWPSGVKRLLDVYQRLRLQVPPSVQALTESTWQVLRGFQLDGVPRAPRLNSVPAISPAATASPAPLGARLQSKAGVPLLSRNVWWTVQVIEPCTAILQGSPAPQRPAL